ncbi:MAG: hypothetical protein M3Z20_13920, partial [Chloroflexota bacterium]|nr:hypothetical protein [Chloroflexota bacterium]
MQITDDVWLVLLVVGARLLIPLAIPRYPLPASVAAIVADLVDGTIAFYAFANVGMTDYQGYDKAFDVYYLSIQYLSTMRNWDNLVAFNIARMLFYYRLAGGLLFDLTQVRAMFLFFPNTFEYFFLFYEAVRLRWNPRRLSPAQLIGAAFAIWVFIKIPQEYWIHVAQLDTHDVKEGMLRVPADTSWLSIIGQLSALFIALAAVVVVTIAGVRWFIEHRLPPADWRLAFNADAHGRDVDDDDMRTAQKISARRLVDAELLEKSVLMSVVTISFWRILPEVRAEALPTAVVAAIIIVANTAISEWLVRRGKRWRSVFTQFIMTAAANLG